MCLFTHTRSLTTAKQRRAELVCETNTHVNMSELHIPQHQQQLKGRRNYKKKSLTTDVSCECGLPHVGFSLYLYVVLAKYTCMYVCIQICARARVCALGALMSVRMSIRCDLNAARVQHHPQSCRGTHGMQPILFIWTSRGYGLLTMYHYSVCLCACVGEREGRAANCLQLCHSLRNKSCTDRQVAEQALCDT